MDKHPRILVIDCEPGFLQTARNACDRTFNVICASDENDGFNKAKNDTPALILLGYIEPQGAAYQLATRLASEKSTAGIPVLIVDVRPDEFPRKGWRLSDGFSHNIKGYTWRPIATDELHKTVEGVLQRSKSSTMNLTEVAQQTEEVLKRIDQLKKLLMSQTQSKDMRDVKKEG